MKLEKGMIIRLNTTHGKHKKGTLYKIKEVKKVGGFIV